MTYFERIVQTAGAASLAALLLTVPALAAAPQTLTVGLSGDFPALDPSKDTSPLGTNYRINVFDALS
jgi:peptide/nickel transport system substrate-binding protein